MAQNVTTCSIARSSVLQQGAQSAPADEKGRPARNAWADQKASRGAVRSGQCATRLPLQLVTLASPAADPHDPTPLDFLESLSRAALVIDKCGQVLGCNRSGRALLGPDLHLHADRLVAAHRASDELLQNLIRTAVRESYGNRTTLPPPLPIQRENSRPILVQVLPIAGLVGALDVSARAILLLTCLDARPNLPESRLTLLFGLTPAEARLAARLGRGQTLDEAADELEVSLGTARNRLKSIFSKTETSRQVELVALLWRVSDVPIAATAELDSALFA